MNAEHEPSLGDVVDGLLEYTSYKKELGQRTVDADPSDVAALSRFQPPPAPGADTGASGLAEISTRVAGCRQCQLHASRTQTVPGQGASRPELVFVGEGPGANEDEQGLAFVGRAGQLLTKMIEAMGTTRDQVWIGNIVKCRPPGNRAPTPEEMEACMPYLKEQLALLQPRVVVCLGATAVKGLLDTKVGITKLRGTWMHFEGIDVMPTYHPAYLLRNPPAKREVWQDLQAVMERLGWPLPERTGKD